MLNCFLKSPISYSRSFHNSALRFGRWTAAEDTLLQEKYQELGPAWTILSLFIKSRSPIECRRRWLMLSGSLTGLNEAERKLVYEDGYDKVGDQMVLFPMEQVTPGPFAKMVASVKPVGFRSQRKAGGWGTFEKLAVREGFEQYGPNWKFIASKLQYRTPRQCRNMILKRYAMHNLNLLQKQLQKAIDITEEDSINNRLVQEASQFKE